MEYGKGNFQAEDYFRQTEEYIERVYGNRISEDDLKLGFPREGLDPQIRRKGRERTLIDEEYRPQAYELPAGSPFTSKDVSMLGYLAAGVQKIELNGDYQKTFMPFLEVARKTGENQLNEVFEQHVKKTVMTNVKEMETDSFFTLNPRPIGGDYLDEMTQEHQLVKDAVCKYDLDALADICKRGLDVTRSSWNGKEARVLTNRYAAGHVCGQVLDMLERNQELKEKVGLTPEDYNYYRGMARVSEIIRKGAKAADMLAGHSQELTPEQKAEYEKAYGRYRDFSIMSSLERKNIVLSPEQEQLQDKMIKFVERPDVKRELRERNVPEANGYAMASYVSSMAMQRDSELVSWLGEADEDVQELIFEELHELAQTAQVTEKVPGYDNLKEEDVKDVISRIDKAEGELHNTNILENVLPEEKRIIDSRKSPKLQSSFRTGIDASIKELKKAESSLFRSGSPEYKEMQEGAKHMSETMGTIGDPLTYQDLQRLRQSSEALTKSVEAYRQHKEKHHTGSKWELARIAAADKLMQLGGQITASLDKLEQDFELIPQLRAQKAAWEANQKAIADIVGGPSASAEERERQRAQQRAQKEAVGKEVIAHMNKRYGKDAPSVYQAAGSMMAARTENGKQKTVSAVEHLGKNIMKYKTDVAIYINGGKSVDKNQRQHLRNTMARMVAMENIVAERVINRYQLGQKTVAPGPQESAYAKDPAAYLKEIMGTDSFKKAMEDMTPEKMKDFVLNDGAVKLVRSMHQEAVEKAQEEKNVNKAMDAPKNQQLQERAPQKTAPVMGQS